MFNGSGYINTGVKRYFAYKIQYISKILASPIELIIMVLIWNSIFNFSGLAEIGGLTFKEMINYYIIVWIMSFIVTDNSDQRLGSNVYNGMLNIRLLIPIKIEEIFFFDSIGEKLGSIIAQVIPFTIISVIFLGFSATGLINTLFAIGSFMLSYMIYFYFNMFFGLISFKLRAYRYISRIKDMIIDFLSGKILPLSFFPASVSLLPFKYIYSAPANIFLGKYDLLGMINVLIIQALWIIALFMLFKFSWSKAIKNYEGVGT